jgi:hypothetical protein
MGAGVPIRFQQETIFWGFILAIQRNEVPLKKADLFCHLNISREILRKT